MEFSRADLVVSVAGRDKGMLFYVLEADGAYILVANGKQRPLERPKRKNAKHVRKVPRSETSVAERLLSGGRVLNSELRKDLAACSRRIRGQNQGRL